MLFKSKTIKKPIINNNKSLIAKELIAMYNQSLEFSNSDKQDIKRIKTLRPSQLPFCPIGFFIEHASKGCYRSLDMRGNFFTKIGTTMHTVLQEFLGLHTRNGEGVFLADWQCSICRTKYPNSLTSECCDFPCIYDELGINYSFADYPNRRLIGHIDGVYKSANGDYYIIDYKSTSLLAAVKKLKDPGVVYEYQVETYACFLRLQYKIKVKGIVLFFVPRDDPSNPTIWSKDLTNVDYKRILKRSKLYLAQHDEVLNVTTIKEALLLARHGKCANFFCKHCKGQPDVIKSILSKAHAVGTKNKYLPLKDL
jgi:hypothetical protein